MTAATVPGQHPRRWFPAVGAVRHLRTGGPAAGVLAAAGGVGTIVLADGSPWARLARLVVVAGVAALAAAGSRRWRAALEPVVACAGLAAGFGIGLPHLAKAGPSLRSLAGIVALLGGAVVLAHVVVSTWRALPAWWRWPVVAAALVGNLVVVWSLSFAVAATNLPPLPLGDRRPADLGLAASHVTFRAADGVRLAGWWVPGSNGAAVALLHGAGSTRDDVLDEAAVLHRLGYGVLLYDARGHGESGGRAMDFGWYGDADLAGALTFLAGRPEVDPDRLAVVGMSMGGEQAVGAAASDPRIKAVVAEGATHRVTADSAWLSDAYGVRGTLQRGIDWLTYAAADVLTDARPPIALADAVAEAAPRPVLFITAGDVPDEARAAEWFQRAAPASVERWNVPGASHTGALAMEPEEWERLVGSFLATALPVR